MRYMVILIFLMSVSVTMISLGMKEKKKKGSRESLQKAGSDTKVIEEKRKNLREQALGVSALMKSSSAPVVLQQQGSDEIERPENISPCAARRVHYDLPVIPQEKKEDRPTDQYDTFEFPSYKK